MHASHGRVCRVWRTLAGAVTGGAVPVALVTFALAVGAGISAAALPLYVRSLGGDYRDLGFIGASQGLAYAMLTIPFGAMSDRVGRRPVLVAAALTMAAAACCYLSFTEILWLAGGRFLEGMALAAFWPTLWAFVTDEFGRRAGAVIGMGFATYAAAFVVGSSAAGFLIEDAGPQIPFVIQLLASVVTAPLVLSLVGARSNAGDGAKPVPDPVPMDGAGTGPVGSLRRGAYVTGAILALGNGVIFAFLPAYVADLGQSAELAGLLLGSYWMARVAASLMMGRIWARVGWRRAFLVVMCLNAASAAFVGAGVGIAGVAIGTFVLGITVGAGTPASAAMVSAMASERDRGFAMGIFEAAAGVSTVLAGIVGGYAAESFGVEAPYVLVACVAGAWSVWLALRLRPRAATAAG